MKIYNHSKNYHIYSLIFIETPIIGDFGGFFAEKNI